MLRFCHELEARRITAASYLILSTRFYHRKHSDTSSWSCETFSLRFWEVSLSRYSVAAPHSTFERVLSQFETCELSPQTASSSFEFHVAGSLNSDPWSCVQKPGLGNQHQCCARIDETDFCAGLARFIAQSYADRNRNF